KRFSVFPSSSSSPFTPAATATAPTLSGRHMTVVFLPSSQQTTTQHRTLLVSNYSR
ncbi:hypothetical protein A2U01_0031075, partial [Trifolium medium]|nr:hypothetical protein [Trifolium medium]